MKYKKCPVCGKMNLLRSKNCTNEVCGTSLMNAEIVNSETEKTQGASMPAQVPDISTDNRKQPSLAVRQCPDCGRVLPYRIKKCECGASLIAVPPMASDSPAPKPVASQPESCYAFRSEDGKCEIPLRDGEDIILGRDAICADYLSTKRFVSGSHARIRVLGSNLTIEHIGKTNPTLVNGVKIERESPYSLNEGDLVAMGAQPGQGVCDSVGYFRVIRKQP